MLARRGLEAVTFWNKGRTYLLYAALPVPQLGGQAAASAVIAVGVILAFVHVAGFEGGRRAKVELARLGRPRDHLDDRRRINVPGQINLVAPPDYMDSQHAAFRVIGQLALGMSPERSMDVLRENLMVVLTDVEGSRRAVKRVVEAGATDLLWQFQVGGLDNERVTNALRLFAKEVVQI